MINTENMIHTFGGIRKKHILVLLLFRLSDFAHWSADAVQWNRIPASLPVKQQISRYRTKFSRLSQII